MTPDLDALLIALYVEIDDRVIPSGQRRPGQPKRLSDAELVCLAVAQVLLGARSEHHWLRMCHARLGHLFPYLPKQPGYHKRLKAAAPLLATVMDHLARQSPGWYDPVRLIDATPVPCGASRETVRRSELAGWAHYGYCAAHSRYHPAAAGHGCLHLAQLDSRRTRQAVAHRVRQLSPSGITHLDQHARRHLLRLR